MSEGFDEKWKYGKPDGTTKSRDDISRGHTGVFQLRQRRRIQNRIAQRNYRKNLKGRLEDLEKRAGSSDEAPLLTRTTENQTLSSSRSPKKTSFFKASNLTRSIFQRFASLVSVLSTEGSEGHAEHAEHAARVVDDTTRFRIWADNIGAHHPALDARSTEARLKDAPEVAERICDILAELRDNRDNAYEACTISEQDDALRGRVEKVGSDLINGIKQHTDSIVNPEDRVSEHDDDQRATNMADHTTPYTSKPDIYHPVPVQTEAYHRLPCEFVGLASCDYSFDYDDTAVWIEHTIQVHLSDELPNKVLCWFCDEYSFDASHPDIEGNRRTNFYQRIRHIRDHFLNEGKTVEQIRPDFHMLEHLNRHGLITKAAYTKARRYCEVPRVSGIYAPGYVPEERWVRRWRSRGRGEQNDSSIREHPEQDLHTSVFEADTPEYGAEVDVQLAQQSLTEHRSLLVKVLDALVEQVDTLDYNHSKGAAKPRPMPSHKLFSADEDAADTVDDTLAGIAAKSQPSSAVSGSYKIRPQIQVKYQGYPIGPPSPDGAPGATHRDRKGAIADTRCIVEDALDLCDAALGIERSVSSRRFRE
ncbi:Uu.00g023620.m01.CDS01 [Anthostomella pinea]|uniref:Uu.00g023620.m01.CDS01 n=1 Tax=Anthostomella pinea TaxID=933095 RepID=A0AAI8W045_9PEZI|nr:Uu.00g023620.m01.CDS01 [Anthostomella pinea]